uniref:REST corepressor 3 n=1 Tax=Cacopsylla melanoneura TaxID=428564 RepID=A0A8D8YWU6_9HEMI
MDLERNGHYSDSDSNASDCSSNDEDKIHVGSEYQANVPNNVLDKSFCYLELDKSDPIWLPSKINSSNENVQQFVHLAFSKHNIGEEQALSLLNSCGYDLNKANQTLTQTKRLEDTLDKWSHQEREHFINAYNYHGKKFKLIQGSLPNKSIGDLVDYYYTWKKTRNSVSLITQYCNVLALQHNALPEEPQDVKPSSPLSPPISLDVQDMTCSQDQISYPPSTQSSGLGTDEPLSTQSSSPGVEPLSQSSGPGVDLLSQSSGLGQQDPLSQSSSQGVHPLGESSRLGVEPSTSLEPLSSQSSDMETPISSQSSGLGINIDSIEPSISSQEMGLVMRDIADSNLLHACDSSNNAANVLNLKELVPEHLTYLLECLESTDETELGDSLEDGAMFNKSCSSQMSSMFARCSNCKNIMDTWSFSSSKGIICYSCKPNAPTTSTEETMCNDSTKPNMILPLDEIKGSTEGTETTPESNKTPLEIQSNSNGIRQKTEIEDISALNRLNEMCKQTCEQEEDERREVSQNKIDKLEVSHLKDQLEASQEDQESEQQKHHKLKLIPRGLYFSIVDYIEIATNSASFVDEMFKSMDRDVANLVKKVRSNNISTDAMMDQIDRRLPLDKYRSSNNNNSRSTNNMAGTEEKVGVLWSDTEIILVLQGFLKYGLDFESIAEILETKTNKQVDYFYRVNKSYYDLDLLISEHNSNKKAEENSNLSAFKEEQMEVDS